MEMFSWAYSLFLVWCIDSPTCLSFSEKKTKNVEPDTNSHHRLDYSYSMRQNNSRIKGTFSKFLVPN